MYIHCKAKKSSCAILKDSPIIITLSKLVLSFSLIKRNSGIFCIRSIAISAHNLHMPHLLPLIIALTFLRLMVLLRWPFQKLYFHYNQLFLMKFNNATFLENAVTKLQTYVRRISTLFAVKLMMMVGKN